ncbi:MAG: 2,3,4,5-tetrahydropyridine-2,6-dicarboxylate N-succinyltransferase [Vicinamibacteria bacterium]
MDVNELRDAIERLYELPPDGLPVDAEKRFLEFRGKLSRGEIRAAEPSQHGWIVNTWVKKGILLGFRLGRIQDFSMRHPRMRFFDKHTFPLRELEPEDQVRIVPGGSSIREGAFVGKGVVCMPPMFVNVGAYVDEGTMIDSNALVGSCAQIGRRVHLSAGVQIGGVLEPVGAVPVIVEDRVLVGGNCGIYEGTIVKKEAVLAPGTLLTRSTPVYDLVNETTLRGSAEAPLTIPRGAVVVPGSRPARGSFASRENLHLYAPVIVKYRDPGTDAAVALEEALRL